MERAARKGEGGARVLDDLLDLESLAVGEAPFGKDEDASDQDLEEVLGAQGDGHAEQAEAGDQRGRP